MSPEMLFGEYDEKCDIWSAGVILFLLLGGDPPFDGKSEMEIYKKIENIEYSFNSSNWANISEVAKDLIKNMLCTNNVRLSAQNVLKHKWFENKCYSIEPLPRNVVDNIKKYTNYNKIKKAILLYIASRLNDKEIRFLRDTFYKLDTNNDGSISLEEFRQGNFLLI